jgi:hypothetical protein
MAKYLYKKKKDCLWNYETASLLLGYVILYIIVVDEVTD